MNLNRSESVELASALAASDPVDGVDTAICVPYVYLDAVGNSVSNSPIGLGGQDVYFEASGAFTGEISTSMLKDMGCQYVILGHSERRNVIGECNALINRKVKAVLDAGMTPILCVGELLEQREAGETLNVVKEQFEGSLADVTTEQMEQVVIAYEPVWAIGTGKTATPEQAQEVHADLRKIIGETFGDATANSTQILYGGSVKPDNASDLLAQSDIDGALVGGASLKSDSFLAIAAAGKTAAAI